MSTETWDLWMDGECSPYMNMAIDELLLARVAKSTVPLIRIYGWDCPSVSIGYVQKFDAAPRTGYTVVRRPTGGGVVFHDRDLTYTAVVPPAHPICSLDRVESYRVFHRAVLLVLSEFGLEGELAPDKSEAVDRATMQCFTTPTRYDVLSHGRKFAGAAQRRGRDGILHQGSISLEASRGDRVLLAEKLIKALRKELKIDFKNFDIDTTLINDAEILAEEKYSTEAWNVNKIWRKLCE